MAKSPIGGSRAYLKGRIGSDVYSIGKDGKGKRQQVVRALAEIVSNPRTPDQMVNRMIMSTVMQASKFFGSIIDHSFDAVSKGQPSISEFIRRNYAILKAGTGQYNEYQEKGVKINKYVVSDGKAIWPIECTVGQCTDDESEAFGMYGVTITLAAHDATIADLRAVLQSRSVDDYITIIGSHNNDGDLSFYRAQVNPALPDTDLVSAHRSGDLFVTDGPESEPYIKVINPATAGDKVVFLGAKKANMINGTGAILSQKADGKWQHTSCQLVVADGTASNFDTALATYPVGSEMFLNGGDL